MKCDDLTAYLDGQTGFFGRLAMRAHLVRCAQCRQHSAEWLCLSRDISRLEGEPVPLALSERLMADAMTAAADARSRTSSSSPSRERAREVKDMRRVMAVAGFAAVLVALGVWLLPRGDGNYALAAVARAMASVRSVHFVGWFVDHSGEQKKLEGWLKGPDKYRMIEEGYRDEAIDRDKATTISLAGPDREALVQPAEKVEPEITIAMFRNNEALDFVMKHIRAEVTGSTKTTLNGIQVTVTELSVRGGKALIYVDEDTDLIARFEQYSGDGELMVSVEKFQYDADFPDSVFSPAIPKGIPVVDLTAPISPEKAQWRRQQQRVLEGYEPVGPSGWRWKGPGLHQIYVFAGCEEEAPYHPGFSFKLLKPRMPDNNSLSVFYLPDQNVYRVLGTARVKGPNGFSRVVEDENIRLPGKPQIYEILMDEGKPGAFCSLDKAPISGLEPYRFLNVGTGPLTILWDKSREAVVIRGKAKLLPTGDVYADMTVLFGVKAGFDARTQADHLDSLRDPDYRGLPAAEAEVAREELAIMQRRYKLLVPANQGVHTINGAPAESYRQPSGRSGDAGVLIEQSGRARPYIYTVPSRQEYYIIGRARVKAKGRPDRIVKNAVVNFDGDVISTER